MNKTSVARQVTIANFLPPAQGMLQRKCACGNHVAAEGECNECKKKKSGLQRKCVTGASNNPLKLEADRVAAQVMAAPTQTAVSDALPRIQRLTEESTGRAETMSTSVDGVFVGSGSSLEPAHRRKREQQFGYDFSQVRLHSGATSEPPKPWLARSGDTSSGLNFGKARSYANYAASVPVGDAGQSLPPRLRSTFEEQFQTSLDDVRLHDSSNAASFARRHRANGLTIGRDIYLGKGRYKPEEQTGRALLAHEITHVLQQRPGPVLGTISAAEAEASAVANRSQSASARHRIQRHVAQPNMPLRDAASLKAAIEDELDDFFVGIDNTWPQIRKEAQSERDQVRSDKVLERNIRREVNEMELLKTYLLLTFQNEASFPAHFKSFIEATDMLGTHEARIYSILRGVTPGERKEMQDMPGVVEVIEDEMSGKERQLGLQLLYGGVEAQGEGVTSSRTSTHLEISERYQLSAETAGSFDDVVRNLAAAAGETSPSVLLSGHLAVVQAC